MNKSFEYYRYRGEIYSKTFWALVALAVFAKIFGILLLAKAFNLCAAINLIINGYYLYRCYQCTKR